MSKRRRYHGIVGVGLGDLPLVGQNVNVGAVAVGSLVGLAGAGLVQGLVRKYLPNVMAQIAGLPVIGQALPLVTGGAFAAVAYFGFPKVGMGKYAKDVAAGSLLAGITLTAINAFRKYNPVPDYVDFSGVVSLPMYGGYNGLLVRDGAQQMGGLLVADKSTALNELGAMSIGDDDADTGDGGLAALAAW